MKKNCRIHTGIHPYVTANALFSYLDTLNAERKKRNLQNLW